MNKALKIFLFSLCSLVFAFVVFALLWLLLYKPEGTAEDVYLRIEEIANENANIDLNEDNGLLYVNNEIIVFARISAPASDMAALATAEGAALDPSLKDIGVYRFIYSGQMTYDDLKAKVTALEANSQVDRAFLNLVVVDESNTEGENSVEERDPVYPEDDWEEESGDSGWNTAVPSGHNWGMEAIDAPGAWAYLDQMNTVNIGLIDSIPDISHTDLSFTKASYIKYDSSDHSTNIRSIGSSDQAADHGTHVAGIMAAGWNNGKGVAGVTGGKANLYYSKSEFVETNSFLDDYHMVFEYVVSLKNLIIDNHVQVINISQGFNSVIGFAASRGNENAVNFVKEYSGLTEYGLSRIIEINDSNGGKDFVICVSAGNSNNQYFYKDNSYYYGYRTEISGWESFKSIFGWEGERGDSDSLYNSVFTYMTKEEVKDRIIVVGSVGIDQDGSSSSMTKYRYSNFSCIGSRVDIAAPGEYIYSCVTTKDDPDGNTNSIDGLIYSKMSGTSMAAPHVSGVAGLVFACNPELSGPEVKQIILSSTTNRFYYKDGQCGLVNAKQAVVTALQTKDRPVSRVLKTEGSCGLDLCFIVDTTGSMGDDIDNAKANMSNILSHLSEKTSDYRVALIDYRDFAERTGISYDYPYKIQLQFTNDDTSILNAINGLGLGNGGDTEETVYSALMASVGLSWRANATKVIIILGDAAPLDPEPNTGYTFNSVLTALQNASIAVDYNNSDRRVLDSISVYSIGTSASDQAADFFRNISDNTGGTYVGVADASQVSNAITDSIDQIDIVETVDVKLNFGESFGGKRIDLYRDDAYIFSFETGEDGSFRLDSIEPGKYSWRCPEALAEGTFDLGSTEDTYDPDDSSSSDEYDHDEYEGDGLISIVMDAITRHDDSSDEPDTDVYDDPGDADAAVPETLSVKTSQLWFSTIINEWTEHKANMIITSSAVILMILIIPALIAYAVKDIRSSGRASKQKRTK